MHFAAVHHAAMHHPAVHHPTVHHPTVHHPTVHYRHHPTILPFTNAGLIPPPSTTTTRPTTRPTTRTTTTRTNPFASPTPPRQITLPITLAHMKVTPYVHTTYIHRETLSSRHAGPAVLPNLAELTYGNLYMTCHLLAVFEFPKLAVSAPDVRGEIVVEDDWGQLRVGGEYHVSDAEWEEVKEWLGRRGVKVRFEFQAAKKAKAARVPGEPSDCAKAFTGMKNAIGKVFRSLCKAKGAQETPDQRTPSQRIIDEEKKADQLSLADQQIQTQLGSMLDDDEKALLRSGN